jgi:hypothetical protein
MYGHRYEPRTRPARRTRLFLLALILLVGALLAAGLVIFPKSRQMERPVHQADGIKRISTVKDTNLAVYDGEHWEARFWNGVNMGDTLPGHAPGELAPTREDYLRWFPQMKEMNVDVVRVYTILEPEFYEALEDFNSEREDPLWLIQGVWSPEEQLIGKDEGGRDAYTPEITEEFRHEIRDAVHVIHGDADLPERPGHASGRYRTDVSEYVLGWMIGTEWFPYAVRATNEENSGKPPYSGEYFRATEDASPFESWLAWMMDTLAEEEMEYGWQHPASFTNWLTTDPLSHPNEPDEQEDLVPVDPMHVAPTPAWRAGYFAQYHIYPYYPDFLRYEDEYKNYIDDEGKRDPYAGYLDELRAHHEGIPLLVGEFGVPSSRGIAHRGPLGRDQGYHTEEEQGRIDADMLDAMHDEGYDGGILFALADEWFKFTWNTIELELPGWRRRMWRNPLTNEEHFGVIANDPGTENEAIYLDGETNDWEHRAGLLNRLSDILPGEDSRVIEKRYPSFDLSVAHDEAYLYLLLKKREGEWDFDNEELDVGFGTLQGGSTTADLAPGLTFPDGGIQFLLRVRGEEDSRMLVNSGYDQHTWLYAHRLHLRPNPEASQRVSAGDFLPWRLALNRGLYLPQTKETVPFEEIEVGIMRRGITDPASEEFNNLADWYAKGNVLEIRMPWMLIGFTDPSSLQVWDNPYEAGKLSSVETAGVRVYPVIRSVSSVNGSGEQKEVEPLDYGWEAWDAPHYRERRKESYSLLREAFADETLGGHEEETR